MRGNFGRDVVYDGVKYISPLKGYSVSKVYNPLTKILGQLTSLNAVRYVSFQSSLQQFELSYNFQLHPIFSTVKI